MADQKQHEDSPQAIHNERPPYPPGEQGIEKPRSTTPPDEFDDGSQMTFLGQTKAAWFIYWSE